MERDIETVLAACGPMRAVEPEVLTKLVGIARVRQFKAGAKIVAQGRPCPGMFVVDWGRVKVYKLAPSGREHVLHLCGPNQTFAEVAAIGGFDLPANAAAVEPSRCVMLPTDDLHHLLNSDHALCRQLLVGMSFWVRHLVELLEDIVLRDAAGRLARLLLRSPVNADGTIGLPGLKQDVASHLNLTSETLSRVLRRFTDEGLISSEPPRRIRMLDHEALEQLARGE